MNCHREHFNLHTEKMKEFFKYVSFQSNEIYDCVGKTPNTAANQDRVTANSHLILV